MDDVTQRWRGRKRQPIPWSAACAWADARRAPSKVDSTTRRAEETPVITAIALYDLPPHIGLEECPAHFTKIAPDFLKNSGPSA
jgi:hypothetical protein